MAVVGDLLVQLAANTAQFVEDMGKAAASVEQAGTRINAVCDGIKEALEGIAVVIGFEKIVEAAGAAEASLNQVKAVINSTGDAAGVSVQQVQDLAEGLGKMTGVDDAVITSMESMLLGFRNMSGAILPQASKATMDLAAHMHIDLTSAARMVGRALADPTQGMNALTRAGVTLSDSQKAMVKQFMASGDVLDAQKVILNAIKAAAGGAAEAARNGLTGAFKAVQSSAIELLAALGAGDGGGLRYALEVINKLIEDAAGHAPELRAGLEGIAAAGATLLALKLPELFGKAAAAIAAMSVQGRIAMGLAALVGVMVSIRASTAKAGDGFDIFTQHLGTTLNSFANLIPGLANFVVKSFASMYDAMRGDEEKAHDDWISATKSWETDFVGNFVQPAKKWFADLNEQLAKWNKDTSSANANQGSGGAAGAANAKELAKAAKLQAEYQRLINQEHEKTEQFIADEERKAQSIVDNLQEQLAKQKEITSGVGDEQSQLNKVLGELAKCGQSYMDFHAQAEKLVSDIAAQKKQQEDQKKVIDEIFKSSSNVFQKQQQIAMAYQNEQINAKQYGEAMTKIEQEKAKAADEAIKKGQEQDKIGQNILANLTEQLAAITNKVNGEKALTPMMELEAKLTKEINDPTQRAQVLEYARQIQTQIDQQNAKYAAQLAALKKVEQEHALIATKIKQINDLEAQGVITTEQGTDAINKYKQQTDSLMTSVKSLGQSFASTFANAITGGTKFSAVVKSIITQLIQMIVRLVIVDTLMMAIRSMFTFGIGAGPSGMMTALAASKAASGAFSMRALGYATGGRPPIGQPYMVGENGPEIRVDDSPGTIYTMNQIRGLSATNSPAGGMQGGQGNVTIQVQNNAGAQVSASAYTDPAGNRNLQIVVDQAITNAAKAGGSLYQLLAQSGLYLRNQPT